MQILDVEVAIRCHGSSMATMKAKNGAWTLIDEVENDKVLQDKNYTSYNFPCEGSTSYQYFKWEISAIHSGSTLQVGEFELKLKTCSHKNADGSSALGEVIKTVEPTCTEHGYTTHRMLSLQFYCEGIFE